MTLTIHWNLDGRCVLQHQQSTCNQSCLLTLCNTFCRLRHKKLVMHSPILPTRHAFVGWNMSAKLHARVQETCQTDTAHCSGHKCLQTSLCAPVCLGIMQIFCVCSVPLHAMKQVHATPSRISGLISWSLHPTTLPLRQSRPSRWTAPLHHGIWGLFCWHSACSRMFPSRYGAPVDGRESLRAWHRRCWYTCHMERWRLWQRSSPHQARANAFLR